MRRVPGRSSLLVATAGLLAIVTLAFSALVLPAPTPASATPASGTETFTASAPWTVPAGVSSVTFTVSGARGGTGGGGYQDSTLTIYDPGGSGGVGAVVTGKLAVTSGEVLSIGVATDGSNGGQGSGNGGGGGGGGGASKVTDGSTNLVTAGGGGGGGGGGAANPLGGCYGGNGGNAGITNLVGTNAHGSCTSSGGAGANSSQTGQSAGSSTSAGGGGGGGGGNPPGTGGTSANAGGGGGGGGDAGASGTDPTFVSNQSISSGSTAARVTFSYEILTATTTSVSVAPGTTAEGGKVTYSATVSSSGGTPGHGDVVFSTGSTTLCSAPVSNGSATCAATSAPVGSDTVTGSYSGDSNFTASSGTATLTVGEPPSITAVSPTTGSTAGGTIVTISGSGFAPDATVAFGGTDATTMSVVNTREIEVLTPPGPVGSVPVTVSESGVTASGPLFTYAGPSIASLTPSTGSTAEGTIVTIAGSGFAPDAAVSFGGVAAATVSVVSPTEIQTIAPAGTAGTVLVTVSDGTVASNGSLFTYTAVPPPSITSLTPASGYASGGTVVTIAGSGFASTATVEFGKIASPLVSVLSSDLLQAVAPAEPPGSLGVVVTVGSTSSDLGIFTYLDPSITSITPAAGSIAGGTIVTITGDGFASGARVTFGDVPANLESIVSPTEIQVVAPAGSAGPVRVTVLEPTAISNGSVFTYVTPPAPVITAITPDTGWTFGWKPGFPTVTITGANLDAASAVDFGTVPVDPGFVVADSSTAIEVDDPAHSVGPVEVTVTTPGGTSIGSVFTYVELTITSSATGITPTAGSTSGGTMVTVKGTGFTSTATVAFGTTSATTVIVTKTGDALVAKSPAHAAGPVKISVTSPGGTAVSTQTFTYLSSILPAPMISGLTPTTGPTRGDTLVSLTGANLTGASEVTFGATPGSTVIVASTGKSLTARTPAHPAGTLDVSVTTPGGTTSSVGAYTYVVPPNNVTGYWTVASDGGVFTFGQAQFYGSMGGKHLNEPVVGMAPSVGGQGYWLVASDGGIFSFGNARFYGSMGGTPLNKPIVGMAATPTGRGYWLVASDGGIFSFGNARFDGSMGGTPLNKPIVGMAATATGGGYWLVASDGGIFSFGSATFYGSMGGNVLNDPMVGMSATPTGLGYWTDASDGGIFSFGSATFLGSMGGLSLDKPMVGMATVIGT